MDTGRDGTMYCKIIGAIVVITACGGFGFKLAAAHNTEEKYLRQLTSVLDYMACELQYRRTPLPELCRLAAIESNLVVSDFFLALSQELEDQLAPDVKGCVEAALKKHPKLPELTCSVLELLGQTLGRFDLQGQLTGLETARQECRRYLNGLSQNKQSRLRGYQTLGLCAGAALAILLL